MPGSFCDVDVQAPQRIQAHGGPARGHPPAGGRRGIRRSPPDPRGDRLRQDVFHRERHRTDPAPTLVLNHNKTLASQLYSEFKEFFPDNLVEYFVSYYDYYQPEAYIPSSGTYIEKDLAINEEIEKLGSRPPLPC